MPFSLIVSMDLKGGIGINNKLPWHIPGDMDWFKINTLNKTVIMGSNTYFSLPNKFKPLPNRKNVVLTKDQGKRYIIENEGAIVRTSVDDVIAEFKDEDCFIIGGQNIYDQFIEHVNYLYITKVAGDYKCDSFFKHLPKDNDYEWIKCEDTNYKEEGLYVFKFLIFKRIVDYNDLEFIYNFYQQTLEPDQLSFWGDKYSFRDTEDYARTKDKIKLYIRTNKLEKIKNMINEIKPSN